jgi:hypothetical protein
MIGWILFGLAGFLMVVWVWDYLDHRMSEREDE